MAPADFMESSLSLGWKNGTLAKNRGDGQQRLLLTYRFPSRDHHRLQRQAQVCHPRIRLLRLRVRKIRARDIVKLEIRVKMSRRMPFPVSSTALKRRKRTSHLRRLVEVIPCKQFKVPIQAAVAARLSRARPSRAITKTSPQSATAATSPANGSSGKSRKGQKRMKKEIGKVNIPIRLYGGPQSRRIAMSAVTFFRFILCEQQYTCWEKHCHNSIEK